MSVRLCKPRAQCLMVSHYYGRCCCCSGKASRAQLLMKSAWLLHLIGDGARNNDEVARALNQRCYLHSGNGGYSWCLSSSLPKSVGFPIQDEAMDVAQSAPQGAQYHVGDVLLLIGLLMCKFVKATWCLGVFTANYLHD